MAVLLQKFKNLWEFYEEFEQRIQNPAIVNQNKTYKLMYIIVI